MIKNTIRDGGSTALFTVYIINIASNAHTVYAVNTVYKGRHKKKIDLF